jgi:nicotinamide riboside kinase
VTKDGIVICMLTKPIVVNFLGGPGCGKSTLCAGVYTKLKRAGVECELALEYAKDKVWEENLKVLENQVYVLGKQYQRIHRLVGKVDVVLTDSPLFLSLFYGKYSEEEFKPLVLQLFNQYDNINYFVERHEYSYSSSGRYQSLEEALEIDAQIKELLKSNNIEYYIAESSDDNDYHISRSIINKLFIMKQNPDNIV